MALASKSVTRCLLLVEPVACFTLCSRRYATVTPAERSRLFLSQQSAQELVGHPPAEEQPIEVLYKNNTATAFPGITTPYDLAKVWLPEKEVETKIAAVIDSKAVWDLNRPLPADVTGLRLAFKDVSEVGTDPVATEVFWHSSAHLLGAALEEVYGDIQLGRGPALEGSGFFYEGLLLDGTTVKEHDLKKIESTMRPKHPFERLEIPASSAMEMFGGSQLKLEFLQNAVDRNETVSVYRCGNFVDLCKGPHLPHTGFIQAASVLKTGGSVSLSGAPLQRVYAISFPNKLQLKSWNEKQKRAEEVDHRVVGKQQNLFLSHESSPGSPFFLPHGVRVLRRLTDMMRKEYVARGFHEVMSPIIYNEELWEQSGHLSHYADNMFFISDGHETLEHRRGVKPMNCPAHCLMYDAGQHSYRELPYRLADFTALHRNEATGALTGLTRVRQFHQDDAHIFCTPSQVATEVAGCLDFIDAVYKKFGFSYSIKLSTRPEEYAGDLETWTTAERLLKEALDMREHDYHEDPGDGAFYAPKIDVTLQDALGRRHQTATIQLDYQLPERFNLSYTGDDGKQHRPVIIHRAILGSLERMFAILIESTGGKWPLWLSPRQVAVVPVTAGNLPFAEEITRSLVQGDIYAETNYAEESLKKKIKLCQVKKYNYVLVIGDKEQENRTVTIRDRDNAKDQITMGVEGLLPFLKEKERQSAGDE